jgi:4'-phosphopantetheinyl transferase
VLWTARGERELPATSEWLTPREADLAAGLRYAKRRSEYLLRRWVCKQAVALASELPTDLPSLARVEIRNRPTGAPYVAVDEKSTDLQVSITDRAGWAVCVLCQASDPLGCDLEIAEPRSEGFVTDFLTPSEQAYVASRADDERHAAANLVWSAKESALKVLQTGLRRDTRSVEVHVSAAVDRPDGWSALAVHAAEGVRMQGWWRRDGDFLVTVASLGALPPPVALPGSADLTAARPEHSWLRRPLT